MSAGLYPLGVVAAYLGKQDGEMNRLVDEDRFPVVGVPAPTKPMRKVSLLAFHKWLAGHSRGEPLTVAELEQELDRAAAALNARQQAKKKRKGALQAA